MDLSEKQPEYVNTFRQLKDTAINEKSFLDIVHVTLPNLYPEVNFIGAGSESLVIENPNNPDEVIAYQHDERMLRDRPFYLLEKYHMHRVLNMLYPEHFPAIHAASLINNRTVRQRIYEDKHREPLPHISRYLYNIEQKIHQHTGIMVGLDFGNNRNVIVDVNGSIKYVDFVYAENSCFGGNKPLIESFYRQKYPMQSEEETSKNLDRIFRSINRVNEFEIIEGLAEGGVDYTKTVKRFQLLNDRAKQRVNLGVQMIKRKKDTEYSN